MNYDQIFDKIRELALLYGLAFTAYAVLLLGFWRALSIKTVVISGIAGAILMLGEMIVLGAAYTLLFVMSGQLRVFLEPALALVFFLLSLVAYFPLAILRVRRKVGR